MKFVTGPHLVCLHLPLVEAQYQLDPVALTQDLTLCAVVVHNDVTPCKINNSTAANAVLMTLTYPS